jgi:K+ transporter
MIQVTTNRTELSLIRTWPALLYFYFKIFVILNYHSSENLQMYYGLHVTVSAPRTNCNMTEITAQIKINTTLYCMQVVY